MYPGLNFLVRVKNWRSLTKITLYDEEMVSVTRTDVLFTTKHIN